MGKLAIISELCDITASLADLVERMALEMEQAQISESVMQNFISEKDEYLRAIEKADHEIRKEVLQDG